jgi:hypothetical protein
LISAQKFFLVVEILAKFYLNLKKIQKRPEIAYSTFIQKYIYITKTLKLSCNNFSNPMKFLGMMSELIVFKTFQQEEEGTLIFSKFSTFKKIII